MRPVYEGITALTDSVCRDRLNEEYRDLARAMSAALCRKRPSPVTLGEIEQLGLWNHLRPWATSFSLGQGEPAVHDDGSGLRGFSLNYLEHRIMKSVLGWRRDARCRLVSGEWLSRR